MSAFEIKPIDATYTRSWAAVTRNYYFQLGEIAEFALVIGVWIYLFTQYRTLGGYTQAEIITYLIAGSAMGILAEWLEEAMMEEDVGQVKGRSFVEKPFRYGLAILKRGWYKALLPFLADVAVNAAFILYFREKIVMKFEVLSIVGIAVLIALSFVIEFLILYWFRLSAFWWANTPGKKEFLDRIKKILSGVYFPLDLLPLIFLNISLFLPFAYTFFVPAQLYLGKIGIETVALGIIVQLVWIVVIFEVIKKTVLSGQISSKIK